MGPTGVGRTECYRVLAKAIQKVRTCLALDCNGLFRSSLHSVRKSIGTEAEAEPVLNTDTHVQGTNDPVNDYLKMTNKKKVTIRDINPKSISTQELYGYVNMATREWKDGLLSFNMRELANLPDDNPKWIMLDGDLDANWIESMNSVMDDNRLLTLPSNERWVQRGVSLCPQLGSGTCLVGISILCSRGHHPLPCWLVILNLLLPSVPSCPAAAAFACCPT